MARKARQRISYVLPLSTSGAGHRLGVNGLAFDDANSILYTGGRDGVVCAWDVGEHKQHETTRTSATARLRQQIQAHTHWINDISLARSNEVLLSASSDITVKAWRPLAADKLPPQTIGIHSDYVKALAVPSANAEWFASGGLDRKISLWDLNGAGHRLTIDVGKEDASGAINQEKGSVYALAATENIICSGGPESTVRLWDPRTGRVITRLVGHTDNIRDILVSYDGATILTASSDRTVKVWNTIAGRCLHTLTMHDASVWSLHSSKRDLSVFYSTDKTGLVVKTDTYGSQDYDRGMSVAICQELGGVLKVQSAKQHIWTATSKSNINSWLDVETEGAVIDLPNHYAMSGPPIDDSNQGSPDLPSIRKLPLRHMLRLSNTASFPSPAIETLDGLDRRASFLPRSKTEVKTGVPTREKPSFTIEGQTGLMKHVMLNDRRRILTADTSGEIVMWDLLKCVPIQSFGKRDIEQVRDEHTTDIAVAPWCTVNTRTGTVSVVLEENTCFDAELYADELGLDPSIELKEDQRINLGRWVLRYLFEGVISEEIRRDQQFRNTLLGQNEPTGIQRNGAPISIEIPRSAPNGWNQDGPSSMATLRANGLTKSSATPGLAILVASPTVGVASSRSSEDPFGSDVGEDSLSDQTVGSIPNGTTSNFDYFSRFKAADLAAKSPGDGIKEPTTPSAQPSTPPPGEKESAGLFGKKFKMGVGRSFSGMKRLGRMTTKEDRAAPVEEKDESEADSHSSQTSDSAAVHDNFHGCVQKIRHGYEEAVQAQTQSRQAFDNGLPVARKSLELLTAITPSLPAEAPVLKPPPNTIILIQEDSPEAGGVADLLETTVGFVGRATDLVERTAPMWLADVLLKNQIPVKEIVKISFVLEPLPGSNLPVIASETNNRLNANRMLRAKKVLAYIAERLEPPTSLIRSPVDKQGLPPEEYLQLWCQGQVVPPLMTLASIRANIWRGGGDVALFYSANGKKVIATSNSQTTPVIPAVP